MDRPSHLIDAPSVGAAGDALGHPRAVTLGSADVSAHRGVGFCFLGAAVAGAAVTLVGAPAAGVRPARVTGRELRRSCG